MERGRILWDIPRAIRVGAVGQGGGGANIPALATPDLIGPRKAVTPASLRYDHSGVLQVVLELPAEPLDVSLDQAVAIPVLVAPNLIQDCLVGQNLAGIPDQVAEHPVFGGS